MACLFGCTSESFGLILWTKSHRLFFVCEQYGVFRTFVWETLNKFVCKKYLKTFFKRLWAQVDRA